MEEMGREDREGGASIFMPTRALPRIVWEGVVAPVSIELPTDGRFVDLRVHSLPAEPSKN
jgi:hypothetical protein